MIPGAAPFFPEEDRRAILPLVDGILKTGQLTQATYLAQFESACAEMAGTRYALAVNSGGTALELLVEALNVRGREVVVPTQTFVAAPNAVVRAGGIPVFVDVSPENMVMDAEALQRAIGPRTSAVILVHMFGLMARQIQAIRDICSNRGIALIEDAAHAHGASYNGIPAGSLGTGGSFSYYATKILSTGEGGAVTTDDAEVIAAVRSLRDHGRSPIAELFDRAGNNFRLSEISALLGVFQHRRLAEVLEHRRTVAAVYRSVLSDVPGLRPIDPPSDGHAYWRYPMLLGATVDRRTVQQRMAVEAGCRITWMYEPLCHQQPCYVDQCKGAAFPVAEMMIKRLINLPTHHGVSAAVATRIAESLKQIVASLL